MLFTTTLRWMLILERYKGLNMGAGSAPSFLRRALPRCQAAQHKQHCACMLLLQSSPSHARCSINADNVLPGLHEHTHTQAPCLDNGRECHQSARSVQPPTCLGACRAGNSTVDGVSTRLVGAGSSCRLPRRGWPGARAPQIDAPPQLQRKACHGKFLLDEC